MPQSLRRPVLAVAAAAIGATLLSACSPGGTTTFRQHPTSGAPASSSVSSPSRSPLPPQPVPSSSPTAGPVTPAQAAKVIEQIRLTTGDFNNKLSVTLVKNGTSLSERTLDVCNSKFSTEKHRIVRRQYMVTDQGHDVGVSNEVVAYDSPAQAQLAVQQAYEAAAHCPKTTKLNVGGSTITARIRVSLNKKNVSELPVTDNNEQVVAATNQTGKTLYGISVYEVQGRYLDATYVLQFSQPTQTDMSATVRLATVTGKRLSTVS